MNPAPLYADDVASLRETFVGMGVDIDAPGFYDHPAFQEFKVSDPEALTAYAKFVIEQPYTAEYLIRAEQIIRTVAGVLHEELINDGRLGACIDMSMVMSRILDKLGIWNFIVNGAVTTIYPEEHALPNGYYWPIHLGEEQAGHAWVCAPPFSVIDMTIGLQPDALQTSALTPDFVMSKSRSDFPVYIEDLCSHEIRAELKAMDLPWNLTGLFQLYPRLERFLATFKGTMHSEGALTEYIPVYILEPSGALEEITDLCLNGKYGHQIWEEKIAPLLA